MPTLEFKHSAIKYIQSLRGINHDPESWSKWLVELGCPVDANDSESIEVEVLSLYVILMNRTHAHFLRLPPSSWNPETNLMSCSRVRS